MERYLVPAALRVREVPDAGADHVAVLAAGTVVERSDRFGGWVRVRLPDGGDGWVDGRRLTPVAGAAPAEGAEPAADGTVPPEAAVSPSPGPASKGRRRPPALVVATVLGAVVIVVVGVLVLVTGGDDPVPGPPTERAAILLVEPRPGLLLADDQPFAGGLWFGTSEGLVRLTRFGETFRAFAPDEAFTLSEATAIGGREWSIVHARPDGTVTRRDELDDALSTVALPDGVRCCSPVVALGSDDRAAVFTLGEQARSDTLWALDFAAGTVTPVALPRTGLVWDAVVVGDVVFVGMDTGLVAVGVRGACSAVLGEWDQSVSALAVSAWPEEGLRVLALDPATSAVTVLEPLGSVDATDGCRAGARPQVLGRVYSASVAGRPLLLGASFAAVGPAAYLLTTDGDLVIVDVVDPTVPRSDRLLGTLTGFGADPGVLPRLAVLQPPSGGQAWVLVSEPAADRL